jgi:hypothetical protein
MAWEEVTACRGLRVGVAQGLFRRDVQIRGQDGEDAEVTGPSAARRAASKRAVCSWRGPSWRGGHGQTVDSVLGCRGQPRRPASDPGGRVSSPPLPWPPHLARCRRPLVPAGPASPGAALHPPPAPAAPPDPAATATDGIPGSAVPNMAAFATPRPPGSLPPPRAPRPPRAPPRLGHAPAPGLCGLRTRHATPPRAPDLAGHAHLAQLRLRAWSISGGRDVSCDSNQYRKSGTTRC